MDKELYKIAAKACSDVYLDNTDLGTTEYKLSLVKYKDNYIQVLAIAGTNEVMDWLKNIDLWSIKGIKAVAARAAKDIRSRFLRELGVKLLVCGHSKAGATAIAYKKLFKADWCIAFAPARSLRYWTNRKMTNTILFIDPDDPVSKAGFISFGHPECNIIKAKNNHPFLKITDHFMHNWVKFVDKYT
ncbi:MAG: lipase family protein [Desulfobacula sp.]|nr:lipase family protein [Desulfobacula sp.]